METCGVTIAMKASERLERLEGKIDQLVELLAHVMPTDERRWYSTGEFAGHTGRVVFVGIGTFDVSFPDPLLHARELTLYASRNALPSDFKRIIRLIEEGRLDTRPWITHRCGFDAVAETFPSYTKPETGVIKAMVEVG